MDVAGRLGLCPAGVDTEHKVGEGVEDHVGHQHPGNKPLQLGFGQLDGEEHGHDGCNRMAVSEEHGHNGWNRMAVRNWNSGRESAVLADVSGTGTVAGLADLAGTERRLPDR